MLPAVALILVAVLIASAMAISNYNAETYRRGYDSGLQRGNELGFTEGLQKGNETGFTEGLQQGNATGFAEGYVQGLEEREGYHLRDPSYSEMKAFLEADKTNENKYHIDNYNCVDFSKAVKSNALEKGYRCGFVYIEFNSSAHAIVCFNTTDRGIIFIEPQYDREVTLTIGEPYTQYSLVLYSLIYRDFYEIIINDDDIVMSYDIIW